LFSGQMVDGVWAGRQIPSDYIKAKAQAEEMKSCLYAVALKAKGLTFQPPELADLKMLEEAEKELARLRPSWERGNVIPTEKIPSGDKTGEPMIRGITSWADMFSPRQLLCFGVLVEELRALRSEIVKTEGVEAGEAVFHLLSFILDKFANWNSILSSWNPPAGTARSVFDRHDFSFKATFCEMAPCGAGSGLEWATDSCIKAFEEVSKLPHHPSTKPVKISLGSATILPGIADGSITAVVVDPPYADNVQYSELADFFYVWLKRTQGYRRPEWFSTYLCEHDQEVVVNISRHRENGETPGKKGKRDGSTADAKAKAHAFYQGLMTDVFRESRRILRDDGVLTVMFTHKKQEAWEALFSSLIRAGFTIGATWPVKTEGWHSLHQAKKNAAQSTVILVARKRPKEAGVGYFDNTMKKEIREEARSTAERLEREGLNPVDQLVGSFGPAMEVYSRYSEVRTDTGIPVGVDKAIDQAADSVSEWRVQKLSDRGLEGVEPEGKFTLLCWDVLGAVVFRFNEAKLLGNAVGMDVDQLVAAGLVSKTGDKVQILSAGDRRRDKALEPDSVEVQTLFGPVVVAKKRASKKNALKVHPNDPVFRTALDACHALALRYIEASGGAGGIGSAKSLANQHRWTKDSKEARLMEALVHAAPEAVRHEAGKKSVAAQYPEFRAWHALLLPLFGIKPPDWKKKLEAVIGLPFKEASDEEEAEPDNEDEG
jgi:putative DNA methylase